MFLPWLQRKPIKVSVSSRSRDSVSSESAEVYVTIADFSGQAGDGLNFKAGDHVEVISKNSTGWWYVQLGNEEGWVPSSYLDKVTQPIKSQDSLTHSNSHNHFNTKKKLTNSKSQDNLDQIDSISKFSSLEVNDKRTYTSGSKKLTGTQSVNMLQSRSPDPSRRKTAHSTVKESRRSPPPVPGAYHKQETKKLWDTSSRHETTVTKRTISPEASHDRLHTPSGDLAKVLKKKFESENTAAAAVPPVVSSRHNTHSNDKTVSPNKEKKAPPPRPKEGPQKKVGPSRPAVSPALKRKIAATSDAKRQDQWITCDDYSETSDGCISFTRGEDVEVIEDSNNDWWYVRINGKEGYAPVTFLAKKEPTTVAVATGPKPPTVKKRNTPLTGTKQQPPKPAPRGGGRKKRMYKALADYHDQDGGLSFYEGDVLELLDDSDDWWFVKLGTVEGWAPSTYLEPVH